MRGFPLFVGRRTVSTESRTGHAFQPIYLLVERLISSRYITLPFFPLFGLGLLNGILIAGGRVKGCYNIREFVRSFCMSFIVNSMVLLLAIVDSCVVKRRDGPSKSCIGDCASVEACASRSSFTNRRGDGEPACVYCIRFVEAHMLRYASN